MKMRKLYILLYNSVAERLFLFSRPNRRGAHWSSSEYVISINGFFLHQTTLSIDYHKYLVKLTVVKDFYNK